MSPSVPPNSPSRIRIRGSTPAIKATATSLFKKRPWTLTLPTTHAESPAIKEILAIFAPMTFPKERLGVFSKAEVMPTKSSGNEVAREIRRAERTKPGDLEWRDRGLKAKTTRSADLIKKTE